MRSQIQSIATVFITDQLADRKADAPDFLRERLAIQNLAAVMSDRPDEVLPRLVKIGMEICGAHAAGISILEPEAGQFRWHALRENWPCSRARRPHAIPVLAAIASIWPNPSSWSAPSGLRLDL